MKVKQSEKSYIRPLILFGYRVMALLTINMAIKFYVHSVTRRAQAIARAYETR